MRVCRNAAAGAPSTARWSKVAVSVSIGRTASSPPRGDDSVLRRADGDDRGLRRVEDGGEALDGVHAEVRDRERAALEVVGAELVVAGAADDVGARGGDLGEREPLGAADDRDDEPLRRGDGDPDVRARVEEDRVLRELGVHLAVPHERLGGDLREDVGDGDANVRVALAQLRDERVRARHVRGRLKLEDRDLPRLGQAPRDRLADVRERNALHLARHELRL